MMTYDDLHPSERVEIGICDSDDFCVTPGQRRKLNVHFSRDGMGWLQPVLATCKGCERRARKKARATS
jgi:hypothetical protein